MTLTPQIIALIGIALASFIKFVVIDYWTDYKCDLDKAFMYWIYKTLLWGTIVYVLMYIF